MVSIGLPPRGAGARAPGSGLPAEIWHETMVRVHEGVDPRPLPMLRPAPPEPAPQPAQPQRRQRNESNPIEDILRGIFGGGQ